jgi:anti-sigma factor ChrR (cupin superfamily)
MNENQGRHPDELARTTAALYALGALPDDERQSFEVHLRECRACADEVAGFRGVVSAMGGASPADPPAALRGRLMERVAPSSPDEDVQVWKKWTRAPGREVEPGLYTVFGKEGGWEPTEVHGVSVRPLHVDGGRRTVTMLVRMAPGVSYPSHRHARAEECYVLEGDLRVSERTVLHAGDYQRAEASSHHQVQSTEKGCLLFIVSSMDDELV